MIPEELIKKLRTANESDEIRFYCPINKTHYKIWLVQLFKNKIYITSDCGIASPWSYSRLIDHLTICTSVMNPNEPIEFIDINSDQTFMIP